jgi:hypothetical protein
MVTASFLVVYQHGHAPPFTQLTPFLGKSLPFQVDIGLPSRYVNQETCRLRCSMYMRTSYYFCLIYPKKKYSDRVIPSFLHRLYCFCGVIVLVYYDQYFIFCFRFSSR